MNKLSDQRLLSGRSALAGQSSGRDLGSVDPLAHEGAVLRGTDDVLYYSDGERWIGLAPIFSTFFDGGNAATDYAGALPVDFAGSQLWFGGSTTQLAFRGDTLEGWTTHNPVLAARELAIETDTSQFKLGDGVTAYLDLPYGGLQGDIGPVGPPPATIGTLASIGTNPQAQLSQAFPNAIRSDGVINLSTRDLWVYDGVQWFNAGPAGAKGDQGDVGPVGPQGEQGVQGEVGPQGPQGLQGERGDTGPIGPAGADSTVPGPAGPPGADGTLGAKGADGAPGPQGPQGPQGPEGPVGPQGPQGPQGLTGPAGPQGLTGVAGPSGANGSAGATGPQGPAGPTVYPSEGIPVSTGTAWGTSKTAPNGDVVGTSDAQTLSNKTLINYTETVYALSGTAPAINAANGTVQSWTLTANSTPTSALLSGQSVTLMIDDGSGSPAFEITWPSVTWKTNTGLSPRLNTTGVTAVVLWRVGSTLYGARVGDS